MAFKDKIKNWYDEVKKEGGAIIRKNDKNFTKHYIRPCQMISVIGATGSGKSQSILEFLSRKTNAFYRVILFSGSTVDEPLYHLLESKMEGIEMIDDAEELPELIDMNDECKKQEKLIIFDDMINLNKKQLLKIQKWFNSARKYGFTCIAVSQNYTDLPIQMRRNTMIYILFRLNDNNAISQILKNHNIGHDKEAIKRAYYNATQQPHNFFMIDLNSHDEKRYRHNFTDFIKI